MGVGIIGIDIILINLWMKQMIWEKIRIAGNCGGKLMERLAAFEKMLLDIQKQSEYERGQMEKLKSEGKEKTATYRQYFGNRMLYKMILEKYREYGLID